MQSLAGSSTQKSVAAVFGVLAAAAATLVGAVLAVVFAATVVVIGLMATVVIGLTAMAMRARRAARVRQSAAADPTLIEARRVGGHSWVAYGWDGQRRA
jgi:hypothetical protein